MTTVRGSDDGVSTFLPGVAEGLGWYVYALRDPRDGILFYVGKGRGDRVYQHAILARKQPVVTSRRLKLSRIREIHLQGLGVGVEIIRYHIENEDLAYDIEAAVIDALRCAGVVLDANLVAGHGTDCGWRPLDDILAEYAARRVPIADEHRVVLIRIRRRGLAPQALYEATRKWWRMAPQRHNPDFAFSVIDGIVRAAYRIDRWELGEGGRWAFHGELDPDLDARYHFADVRSHLSRGAQNPVSYVHC